MEQVFVEGFEFPRQLERESLATALADSALNNHLWFSVLKKDSMSNFTSTMRVQLLFL